MLAALLDHKSDCIYRCTYESENCVVRVGRIREQKISKFSCHEKLVDERLVSPQRKGSQSKGSTGLGEIHLGVDGRPSHQWSDVMPEQKYLYTIPETAERLSLSRQSVYGLIKSGELLAVYPTTAARISEASISAFVRNLEERERRQAKACRGQFV